MIIKPRKKIEKWEILQIEIPAWGIDPIQIFQKRKRTPIIRKRKRTPAVSGPTGYADLKM